MGPSVIVIRIIIIIIIIGLFLYEDFGKMIFFWLVLKLEISLPSYYNNILKDFGFSLEGFLKVLFF